jgi:HK97 family phage major capsid protein
MDRLQLLAEADSILHKPSFSKEDGARVAQLLALADSLVDRTDLRRAIMAQRARELGHPEPVISTPDRKFDAYLRLGRNGLDAEDRAKITPEGAAPNIHAAQAVGSGATGGYLVPLPFADRFEVMLQATEPLFGLATMFETRNGAPTGYPIVDDVAHQASIVAENAASNTETDTPFTTLAFGQCPTWRSDYVLASVELIADSKFDVGALTAAAFAVRFARAIGKTFITTLLAAAGAGVTTASSSAIAPDEIWNMVDSVDPAYLVNGSWMMSPATFTKICQLKSTTNSYIFPVQFDSAGRRLLCGYPLYLSPSMPAATAGLQPITMGDHSKFLRRQVRDSLQVKTLVEKFALFAQVAYLGFIRVDGGLLKGSGPIPVQALTMHS